MDVLKDFANNTTAHGYSRLVKDHIVRRFLWSFIILGSLVGFGTHTSRLLDRFFRYETATVIENHIENVKFPEVIICSTRVWSDIIEKHDRTHYLQRLRQQLTVATRPLMPNRSEDQVLAFVNKVLLDSMLGNLLPKLREYAVDIRNMVIYCQYNHLQCGPDNFTLVSYGPDGTCYKFKDHDHSTRAHYFGGLLLMLNIEDYHWTGLLSYYMKTTKGALVYALKRRTTLNFNRLPPLGVPTGQVTNMGISYSRIKRSPTPIRPCRDNITIFDLHAKRNVTKRYTFIDCVDTQINNKVYEKCGCVSSALLIDHKLARVPFCLEAVIDDKNGTIVNATKIIKNYDCENKIIGEMETDALPFREMCDRACTRDVVSAHTSSTAIPKENALRKEYVWQVLEASERVSKSDTFNTIRFLLNKNQTDFHSDSVFQQNLLQLHIHVRTPEVVSYIENEAYPFVSFISEAGGMMGLWLGGSLITLVEILEMLILFGKSLCFKSSEKKVENEGDKPSADGARELNAIESEQREL